MIDDFDYIYSLVSTRPRRRSTSRKRIGQQVDRGFILAEEWWYSLQKDVGELTLCRFLELRSWKTSSKDNSTELLLRHFQRLLKPTGVVGCWEAPEVQFLCSCSVGSLRTWVYSGEARIVYLRLWACLFCSLFGLFFGRSKHFNAEMYNSSICCCLNAFFSESVCLGLVLVDKLVMASAWSDAKVAIWELAWAESISNAELCRGATTLRMPCMDCGGLHGKNCLYIYICWSPKSPNRRLCSDTVPLMSCQGALWVFQ